MASNNPNRLRSNPNLLSREAVFVALGTVAVSLAVWGAMYGVSLAGKRSMPDISNTLADDSLAVRSVKAIEEMTNRHVIINAPEVVTQGGPSEIVAPIEFVEENTTTPEVEAPKPTIEPNISEEEAKIYIFKHESGNRLNAVNQYGCYGLGQDCNNRLASECPDWQTDRMCQERFWNKYMMRYGSWVTAKTFWDARVPINGKDKGHWW